MRECCIETKQGKVYYWTSEEWDMNKETIFFFPGLTADHTMFDAQVAYFAGKFNLITWDAPYHGKSRPYTDFSFENTSIAIKMILQELSVEQVITVGQSLGGYYVQAFMLRHPEMVSAFIGIGTTPYGMEYYSKADIFLLKQMEWMCMCFPLHTLKKAMAKQATCSQVGYDNMMNMIAPYKKREFCRLMQIAYNAFLEDNRDMQWQCPVLITYGEFDKVGKVKQYCKMWKRRTGYHLVVIKNAGHNANVDNPVEMNRVMEWFLKVR